MDREKYLAPHLNLPGPSAVADDPTEGRKAVRLNLRNNVDFSDRPNHRKESKLALDSWTLDASVVRHK